MRQTPTTIERLIAAGLITAWATACATHRAPPTTAVAPASRSAACTVVPASVPHLDTISLALTHDVAPAHAPVPHNESERVLFAQLYETLIRLDCLGQPYAGLAASWRADSSGRRWTFTLRDDARFWDGTPLTARDIAASWAARVSSLDATSASPVSAMRDASVQVDDERTLTIVLSQPQHTVPLVLARPEFAVVKSDPHSAWPQGTGDYRVEGAVEGSGDSSRDAVPQRTIILRASAAADTRVLQFRVVSGADARDLLDGGVDVLMTNAPAVLEYAATRQDFVIAPLPWDRTYVLLSPARVGLDAAPVDSAFQTALARNAVRADARGSEGPYWWDDTSACRDERMALPMSSVPATPRIVYPRDDRVARDLADRLVALAALDAQTPSAAALAAIIPGITGNDRRVIATGLPPSEFTTALRGGQDLAYVFPMPRHTVAPCPSVPAVVPLIDTRSSLIVRRGVSGVAVDWDDTPLFAAPRATPPPTEHRP